MNWTEISAAAVTLFLVMDPLGNVPLFHAILGRLDSQRRTRVIARELLIALFILFAFLLLGNSILAFLGLSQSSLNIAGGVLLFLISLRMIFPSHHSNDEEQIEEEPFIVPLAVPLTAGPSTIAVLLLLNSNQPERLPEWSIALLLAWLGATVILLFSPQLMILLGKRGSRALERLMGMILVLLATQMLLNGIRDFVESL